MRNMLLCITWTAALTEFTVAKNNAVFSARTAALRWLRAKAASRVSVAGFQNAPKYQSVVTVSERNCK